MILIELLRPRQWYKNALIFAALFFSLHFFDFSLLSRAAIGFVVLCLLSSAGYIMNDVIDRERDSHHPEKKRRPIASGRVSVPVAVGVACVLYTVGLLSAWVLHVGFFAVALLLVSLTLAYSVYGKHVLFLDVLFIATNFVLRALAGVVLVMVPLSPWFLLVITFLTLYIVTAKRYGDLLLLREHASRHKPVLARYTKELLNGVLQLCMTALAVFYGLYAFESGRYELFVLYPVFLFLVLRYYALALEGHPTARDLSELFTKRTDVPLLIGGALFCIAVFGVYYVA
jgi:4-hydroxybenzoate polyprenyltransferase